MKILHINGTTKGGVFNYVKDLHYSLLDNGIDSYLFLPNKKNIKNIIFPSSKSYHFFQKIKIKFSKLLKKFLPKNNQTSTLGIFYSSEITKIINEIDPDLIHIHWLGNEILSLKQLAKIDKPIVSTLHDMWLFLAHQHYTLDTNFDVGNKNFILKKFTDFLINNKKKLNKQNIGIVATSEWMKKKIIDSNFFEKKKISKIPIGINFSQWFPENKIDAKKILNINTKKRIILFTSMGPNNLRKGFDLLVDSLKTLSFEYQLIVSSDVIPKYKNFKDFIFFENINDLKTRRLLYSAADVLVAPSRVEAFGLVALEAGACNLPSVVFKNTGFEETIIDKKNGYLAEYDNKKDFAEGISWVINKLNENSDFFKTCRENLEIKFEVNKITNKYISLYEDLQKIKKK